jgi:predicted DsbA family dithiol-disulfide isomerase/uncharacterized membrane protein
VRPVHWLSLLRVFALVALATSVALLIDYSTRSHAFCATGSGCDTVRREAGHVFGVPVPAFGLAGFAGLVALSLWQNHELRRKFLPAAAIGGGVVALALLAIQAFKIKEFCSLCVVVDVSAMLAALCGFAFLKSDQRLREAEPRSKSKRPPAAEHEPVKGWAWVLLAGLAVGAPLLWSSVRPRPPVPPAVAELYQPGKINVVEFADFECPFCRMLHARLKGLIASYPGKVNFVRLNMPLDRHEHARGAARAAICAEQQKRGDVMADRLFSAEDLTPQANRRAAADIGLDLPAFDRCIADPRTDGRIDAEAKILRDAGFQGLPTTYVGGQEIVGAQPDEVFRDAFERAQRGDDHGGFPGPAFAGVVGALVVVVVGAGRSRRTRRSEQRTSAARREAER